MSKPNVILILTDDQGYGDASKTGNRNLWTPNIDALERNGVQMEHFYTQPLCAPSRAEILTGRCFTRTGVYGVSRKAEYINLDETTLGDVFRSAGYRTGYFGKWHSGSLYPYHPCARGFEEFYGFCCGHWGYYFDAQMDHNGVETRGKGYIIDDLTEHALAYMQEHRDEPFLCHVAFNTPHSPFQVPDAWFDRYKDAPLPSRAEHPEQEDLDKTRAVLAMVANIDYNIGRIVERTRALGIDRDTIFVFLSDNGPATVRFNAGLKGKKGDIDEGGVRTLCSLTWADHIPAGSRVHAPSSTVDLLPTLAGLCGIPCDTHHPLDGLDLSGILCGSQSEARLAERALPSVQAKRENPRISIRKGDYRYVPDEDALYNIALDPGQRTNLSGRERGLADQLKRDCDAFRQTGLPDSIPERLLPVGYPQLPKAYLNAQDGEPEGAVTWSSVHPNCSYFTHWTDDRDAIRWHVQAHRAGVYRVSAFLTCPEEAIGSELLLSAGDQCCSAMIAEAFDPEHDPLCDRAKRTESYT
ncbi:MAG TPA: sulfatase-like hydrolase/transferase, partial [Clostridia bacterium]|nr:sulfatase-like hydrolase/transferase [Clostridia bacterium]